MQKCKKDLHFLKVGLKIIKLYGYKIKSAWTIEFLSEMLTFPDLVANNKHLIETYLDFVKLPIIQ